MKKRDKTSPERPSGPVLSKDGVPLARARRAPRVLPFLVTGFVLGAVLGLFLAVRGDDGTYEPSSVMAYFVVFFGAMGTLLGGVVFALVDRRS